MTDDIVEFIKEQLGIDEQFALRTCEGPGSWAEPNWVPRAGDVAFASFDDADECVAARAFPSESLAPIATDIAAHIARHDPARVLAEVAAKRRVLERHHPAADGEMAWHVGACVGCGTEGEFADPRTPDVNDCPELRDLAAPYASRPGFKPEWRLS